MVPNTTYLYIVGAAMSFIYLYGNPLISEANIRYPNIKILMVSLFWPIIAPFIIAICSWKVGKVVYSHFNKKLLDWYRERYAGNSQG